MASDAKLKHRGSPLERARAIAPILEARALDAERKRTLPDETVKALADAGLLRICLPREMGGEEPDFVELIEMWEELSRADGSAGWTAMANGSGAAAAAHYCGDEAVKVMFPDDPAATVGGQFAPRGTGSLEAGGWRVTGSYNFGSGSGHSAFVSVGFMVMKDGTPVMAEGGLPEMKVGFVPHDQIHFTDGWHVMGLRGTGSYDYDVTDIFIPDEYTFSLFTKEPKRGGYMFNMGMMPCTAAGHAAWALGVGRHALDEVHNMATEKTRMGHATSISGRLTFQKDYAQAESKLRAARLFVFDAFGNALVTAERGDELPLEQRALLRMAACHATDAAREVADFAHDAAGTAAIRDGSPLHRAFLDIHTGSQHAFINEKVYCDCAEVLLGTTTFVPGL